MIKSDLLNGTLHEALQKNSKQGLDLKYSSALSSFIVLITNEGITQCPTNNFAIFQNRTMNNWPMKIPVLWIRLAFKTQTMSVSGSKLKINFVDGEKNPFDEKINILQPAKAIVNAYTLIAVLYCASSTVLFDYVVDSLFIEITGLNPWINYSSNLLEIVLFSFLI